MPRLLFILLGLGVFVAAAQPYSAHAASTVDTFNFDSSAHEVRYRGLIAQIRCPKCQNVNIAGSDAPIAKDLRVTVHRLLGEGKSDSQILEFLQDRYGDFVLYDPPVRANTLLLWLLPGLGFLATVLVVFKLARRQPQLPGSAPALSEEDAQQLEALVAELGSGSKTPARSDKRAGQLDV